LTRYFSRITLVVSQDAGDAALARGDFVPAGGDGTTAAQNVDEPRQRGKGAERGLGAIRGT
jgi:hypothetical protein